MKRSLLVVAIFIILLSSCAHNVDVQECVSEAHIYGFWGGLWHGIISPLSLISMLWSDNVMYASNNNGGFYALGFALGAGILGFGSSKAKK